MKLLALTEMLGAVLAVMSTVVSDGDSDDSGCVWGLELALMAIPSPTEQLPPSHTCNNAYSRMLLSRHPRSLWCKGQDGCPSKAR